MICKTCGTENADSANFCRQCSAKLRAVCNCWIRKEPYNCGQDQCPGYRLFYQIKSEESEKMLRSLASKVDDEIPEALRNETIAAGHGPLDAG